MANYVKDIALSESNEYAIFFDNVRVDQFVISWNTQTNVDGGIGSASVEMIYLPDLYRIKTEESMTIVSGSKVYRSVEDGEGIENMTNLRIFVKNICTGKYKCVFDGVIKAKSLTKSGSGNRISFSGSNHMIWLNKTIVPLAIANESRLTFPDRMRWKAQGIDLKNVPIVTQYRDITFRGKNIQQMWNEVTDRTMISNKLYSESDVAKFDNPLARVIHMADIDPKYTKEGSAMDFIVTAQATSINSIYVMMNDLIKSVLLEFFEGGDGRIRIKAPFWAEPILKNHVIDPSMILNFSESVNWDSEYSRIIANGGLEWWEDDYSESVQSYVVPSVVYREDGTYSTSATMSAYEAGQLSSAKEDVSAQYTGTWLDTYADGYGPGYGVMRANYGMHYGIDWNMPIGTNIRHIGAMGKVISAGFDNGGGGNYIKVELLEGTYSGYTISYLHLRENNPFAVAVGALVYDGTILGYSGSTGRSTKPHLHIGMRNGDGDRINPAYYLTETGAPIGATTVGADSLLEPTTYERKYGPAIYNVTQEMIKFSTAGATDSNRASMFEMLKEYAKFMLNYLNSAVNIATLQMIGAPWIEPGFNVWLDPIGIDRVYYVSSISHQGSAEGGTYTTLGLTMGRSINDFLDKQASTVSSMRPGESPNVFINQLHEGYIVSNGDFGPIVGTAKADYDSMRTAILKYHMGISTDEKAFVRASHSKFFQSLYGKPTITQTLPTSSASSSGKGSSSDTSGIDPMKWSGYLKKGSKGTDVKELQIVLKSLGYGVGNTGADGIFGSNTHTAVCNFQKDNGLVVDGIVGPKTKTALAQKISKKTSILAECTSLLRYGNKGKYVTELQTLLNTLGYKNVKVDGIFGRETEKAVREFQKENGLTVDGIVGSKTKAALIK